MEALLSAFLAAALAEIGDKTQWLALALGLHFRRPLPVLAGIALAALANSAIAAAAGLYIAPMLTREAATLLLALALLSAAAGALWRQKRPGAVDGWKLGAFASSLLAFFILELGDKTQFLSFAIATRTGSPILTALGATAGISLASTVAVALGKGYEKALPVRGLRLGAGILFLLAGAVTALVALRLI